MANLSTWLVYAAMAVYTVAFIAFAIDASALGAHAANAQRWASKKKAESKVEALAGGHSEGGVITAEVAQETSPEPQAPLRRRAAGIGMSTTWLGTSLLMVGIALRGFAAGRVPWANMYEFTIVSIFVLMAVFLFVNLRHDVRYLGVLATFTAVLGLGIGVAVLYVRADGVQPSLQTYWLVIHVSVATISTGVLAVGGLFAVLQLVKHFGTAKPAKKDSKLRGYFSFLPTTDTLERWSYRLNAIGFVTWTFTIIAGAIWAEHVWGRPWDWDPKETASLVVWLVYAGYLHVRATVGWDKHKYAYFVLAGIVALLFNFYGVNILFSDTSMHAYSGL